MTPPIPLVYRRLSLLFFLAYAPIGALIPLFPLWLEKDLGFTAVEIAWACCTQALGGLVAPLVFGQIADRWVSADRCLAACALAAGGLLWLLPTTSTPAAVFVVSLGFWLVMAPALSLSNAIVFTHLPSPARDFGRARLWGTIGWVAAGWLIGGWFALCALLGWMWGLADALRLGAVMAWLLALYGLTLPHTPPRDRFDTRLAPLLALRLLRRRSFAVYFVCNIGLCVTMPFYSQNVVLLLSAEGVSRAWIGPLLTLSQSIEIPALGLLPVLLVRWGQRWTMLVGAASWALLMAVLAVGEPLPLVIGVLALNGVFICCYLVAGQVYANSEASSDIRASVQALITFANGLGMLGGFLLAGWVRRLNDNAFAPTFAVAAVIATTLVLVFLVGFDGAAVGASPATPSGPSPSDPG